MFFVLLLLLFGTQHHPIIENYNNIVNFYDCILNIEKNLNNID